MAEKPTYEELEQRVAERTSELIAANEQLQSEISERRRMEEAVRDSEERLQRAQKVGEVGDWEFDFETQQIYWSEQVYRLFERDPAQGPPSYEENMAYYYPEDSERLQAQVRRAIEFGENFDDDYHLKLKTEKSVYQRGIIRVKKDENGKIVKLYGTAQDITKLKQTEEALRQSERELKIRNQINNIFLTYPDKKMYAEVLSLILKAMESDYGTFGYFDEKKSFVAPAVTREIYWDKCNVPEKDIIFQKGTFGGIWGRAIKEKKTLISNDGSFNTPKGHISIKNTMVTPVIFHDEVISAIHIANKPNGYDEEDRVMLETIAEQIAPVLYARLQRDKQDKERKLAEEALRESEERFRAIFEGAVDGILAADIETTKFVFANPRICQITGYSSKELLGLDVAKIHPEKDLPYVMDQFTKLAQEKINVALDVPVLRKDKAILHCDICGKIMEIGNNKYLVGFFRDITDRKLAEKALRESEDKYKTLTENSLTGIFIHQDGRFVFVNDRFADIHGYTSEELLGEEYMTLIHPAEREDAAQKVVKRLKKEPVIQRYEVQRLRKDGTTVWCEMMATIIDYRGRPAIMGNIIDITVRRQAEEALKSEREQLLSIFGSINQTIYVSDPKTYEILYVNDAVNNAFKKDLVGGLCYKEFQGLDSPCDFCTNEIILKEKYKPYQWEYHNPILNRDYLITDRIIKWPDGRDARFEIAIDITKRKQTERSLERAIAELIKEHSQRKILSKRLIDLLEKDRHDVAMELHDSIGQILTSLKLNLEMIDYRFKHIDTELGAMIKVAEKRTIQAIRDIKNISHGLMPGILDSLGLSPSLRELFNEAKEHTDIKINFFKRNVPKRFDQAKELAVYRIVQEALTNIVKHAQAKNVFVNLLKKDNAISLSVEDDGIGFDQEETMKISKGKGPLGLIIMRERAIQLGGEFTIESQIDKGTHVLAEIPL